MCCVTTSSKFAFIALCDNGGVDVETAVETERDEDALCDIIGRDECAMGRTDIE